MPTKQFLISPPASPPVGWLPCEEATPIINYELIHAINKLAPGQAHELHPPSNDHPDHPAIIVHIADEEENNNTLNVTSNHNTSIIINSEDSDEELAQQSKIKIQQTRAPDSFLKSKDH